MAGLRVLSKLVCVLVLVGCTAQAQRTAETLERGAPASITSAKPGFSVSASARRAENIGVQASWPRSFSRRWGKPSAARCSAARPAPASRQYATLGRRTDIPFRNSTMAQGFPRTRRTNRPSRSALGAAEG